MCSEWNEGSRSLTGWLNDRLTDWLAGWLTGWLTERRSPWKHEWHAYMKCWIIEGRKERTPQRTSEVTNVRIKDMGVMYTCMHACMHVCLHEYVFRYAHIRRRTQVHMCVCAACMCACMYRHHSLLQTLQTALHGVTSIAMLLGQLCNNIIFGTPLHCHHTSQALGVVGTGVLMESEAWRNSHA